MNQDQSIFTVFFAIFWGAMANVQPKWKPFQIPLAFSKWPFGRVALQRVLLAFILFNIAPLVYFGWTMLFLDGAGIKVWDANGVFLLTIRGIIPAFAVFALNHLWLAFIECKAEWFYAKDQAHLPAHCKRVNKESPPIDPTVEELGVNHLNWWKNAIAAIFYFAIATIIPRLFS